MAGVQIAIPRMIAVVMQKMVSNSQADHESKNPNNIRLDRREEARTWTTGIGRTKRLKSEQQQHELSPSTSGPKLMPPPNDVVVSPSVSEDFIVIGALELASPSKYDLAPGHLKLVLDVLDDLQKTVQRNRDRKLI